MPDVQPPAFWHRPAASAVYASQALPFQDATRFEQPIVVGHVAVMQPAAEVHVVAHVVPPVH